MALIPYTYTLVRVMCRYVIEPIYLYFLHLGRESSKQSILCKQIFALDMEPDIHFHLPLLTIATTILAVIHDYHIKSTCLFV